MRHGLHRELVEYSENYKGLAPFHIAYGFP